MNLKDRIPKNTAAAESQETPSSVESRLQEENTELKMKNSDLQKALERAREEAIVAAFDADRKYQKKLGAVYAVTTVSLLYGFVVTILTAVKSPRFSSDLISVGKFFVDLAARLWTFAINAAETAWTLHETIPYAVIDVVMPGLLAAACFLILFPGVIALVVFLLYKAIRFYVDSVADTASMFFMLATLSVLVWFADRLVFIPCNLVLFFLILQVLFAVMRYMFPEK